MASGIGDVDQRRMRRLRVWGLTIGLLGAALLILLTAVGLAAGAALSGRSPSLTPSAIVGIGLFVVAVSGVLYAFENARLGGAITLAAACGLGVTGGGFVWAGPFLVAGVLLLQAGVAKGPPPPPHPSDPSRPI